MLTDRLATLKKAESLARDGRIQEAIAEYLLLIEDQPGEWSAGNALGDLYLKDGQRDAAADIFVQMADSQREQGFVPKAVALYKKALKARAADERALLGLADVAESQEIFAEARRYLEQVVTLRQARGDASGAAACAERLAQVPTRRAPGTRTTKPALPAVPPAGDAVALGASAEAVSLAPEEADSGPDDTLSLSVDSGSAAEDRQTASIHAEPQGVAREFEAPEAQVVRLEVPAAEPAPERAVIESFGVAPFEPAGEAEALMLSIEGAAEVTEAVHVAPPHVDAVRQQEELDGAHDADAVDLGALLDAPFPSLAPASDSAAPNTTASTLVEPPPVAPEPPPNPVAAVRAVLDEAPRPVPPPVRPAPEVLAPAPTPRPSAPAKPVRAAVKPEPPPVKPAPPPAAHAGDDDGARTDGDALLAELEAAAQVPALRFQASAQLGRLLVARGDLAGAAAWLERAAQESAPVPEHGLSVVYDLAVVCERMGHIERALALFAEIESESTAYRDVRARVERLSAEGGGPGA